MQVNTIQNAVAQGLKKAQRQSEKERRRTARQGAQSGGAKAIYSTLSAAQKAQYARELAEHYRSTQQESDDLSRQSAAKKSGKTAYKAGSSVHYSSSGRAFGGSSGSFGEALGYGKAIGGGIEAGLWSGAVRGPLDLGASKIGQEISSDDTDTWFGKSSFQKEREINAAFLGRLGSIWDGFEAGNGSFGHKLKDSTFVGYNSAFQNLLEGAGRRQAALSGDMGLEALYLGSNALFHALKEYALPAITGSQDKEYNARWLTGKAYGASDRLTEKVSSIPGLRYVDAEKYQKDLTASSPSVRLAGNVSSVVANMLPVIGISAATGSPDAALVALSASAAGNAAKEAYESGATPEQAYYIGLEKGYVEYLTERIFDALGAFGGGTLTPGMKSLLGKYAATKGGRALIKAGGILGEHVEEGVSDWAGTGIERAVLGHTIGREPDKTLAQAMAGQAPWTEEGLVTLLSTLALNGGSQITKSATPLQEKALSLEQQANESTYLRRMEEIGYLPAEGSKNAAHEGAAKSDYIHAEHHGKILDGMRQHLSEIEEMESVSTISGNEFQKTADDPRNLRQKAIDFFNQIGNKVFREGFGEIVLNEAGVRDSLGHGYGKLKAATFTSLPSVLKEGKIISFDPDYQGRGYESYLIAAPVTVAGERCYVGAYVIKDVNIQRYKVHEVLTLNKNGAKSFKTETLQHEEHLRDSAPPT